MADETKRLERAESRTPSIPVTSVITLIAGLMGGGTAAGVATSSTSSAMVRVETQIEGMREEQRRASEGLQAVVLRLDARDQDLDARLRDVERRMERVDPAPRGPR